MGKGQIHPRRLVGVAALTLCLLLRTSLSLPLPAEGGPASETNNTKDNATSGQSSPNNPVVPLQVVPSDSGGEDDEGGGGKNGSLTEEQIEGIAARSGRNQMDQEMDKKIEEYMNGPKFKEKIDGQVKEYVEGGKIIEMIKSMDWQKQTKDMTGFTITQIIVFCIFMLIFLILLVNIVTILIFLCIKALCCNKKNPKVGNEGADGKKKKEEVKGSTSKTAGELPETRSSTSQDGPKKDVDVGNFYLSNSRVFSENNPNQVKVSTSHSHHEMPSSSPHPPAERRLSPKEHIVVHKQAANPYIRHKSSLVPEEVEKIRQSTAAGHGAVKHSHVSSKTKIVLKPGEKPPEAKTTTTVITYPLHDDKPPTDKTATTTTTTVITKPPPK